MRRTNSEEARNSFQASISRIMSIAAAQNVFSIQNFDTVKLKELLSYVLNTTLDSYKFVYQNILAVVEGRNVEISCSQAIPVALIANEMINHLAVFKPFWIPLYSLYFHDNMIAFKFGISMQNN